MLKKDCYSENTMTVLLFCITENGIGRQNHVFSMPFLEKNMEKIESIIWLIYTKNKIRGNNN